MRKISLVLFVIFFISTVCFSAQEKKDTPIRIITSPPNYSVMELVGSDSVFQHIPIAGGSGPNFRYMSFEDAYKIFYENATRSIIERCKNSGYAGACNLRINVSVNDKWYYFYATFDLFKHK
jgi:hypothetical protein